MIDKIDTVNIEIFTAIYVYEFDGETVSRRLIFIIFKKGLQKKTVKRFCWVHYYKEPHNALPHIVQPLLVVQVSSSGKIPFSFRPLHSTTSLGTTEP